MQGFEQVLENGSFFFCPQVYNVSSHDTTFEFLVNIPPLQDRNGLYIVTILLIFLLYLVLFNRKNRIEDTSTKYCFCPLCIWPFVCNSHLYSCGSFHMQVRCIAHVRFNSKQGRWINDKWTGYDSKELQQFGIFDSVKDRALRCSGCRFLLCGSIVYDIYQIDYVWLHWFRLSLRGRSSFLLTVFL